MFAFNGSDATLLEMLSGAGWEPDQESLDFGLVKLSHSNRQFALVADNEKSLHTLGLSVIDEGEGTAIRLSITYGSNIKLLLTILISWQERLKPTSFSKFLEEVTDQFEETYVEREDGEWLKIKSDQ